MKDSEGCACNCDLFAEGGGAIFLVAAGAFPWRTGEDID